MGVRREWAGGGNRQRDWLTDREATIRAPGWIRLLNGAWQLTELELQERESCQNQRIKKNAFGLAEIGKQLYRRMPTEKKV